MGRVLLRFLGTVFLLLIFLDIRVMAQEFCGGCGCNFACPSGEVMTGIGGGTPTCMKVSSSSQAITSTCSGFSGGKSATHVSNISLDGSGMSAEVCLQKCQEWIAKEGNATEGSKYVCDRHVNGRCGIIAGQSVTGQNGCSGCSYSLCTAHVVENSGGGLPCGSQKHGQITLDASTPCCGATGYTVRQCVDGITQTIGTIMGAFNNTCCGD